MKFAYWLGFGIVSLGTAGCTFGDPCQSSWFSEDDCMDEPSAAPPYAGSSGGSYGGSGGSGEWGVGASYDAGLGGWTSSPGSESDGAASPVSVQCSSSADCGSGRACAADGLCRSVVAGCPMTDACLGDPPGYHPPEPWQGIDPTFVGSLTKLQSTTGLDSPGRITVNLDFYADHIYGEALILPPGRLMSSVNAIITGSRIGTMLRGQIVSADGNRSFDATFDARIVSGSELAGTVSWADTTGSSELDLRLYRTSPCGCPTSTSGCITNAECKDGNICDRGRCVAPPPCGTSADCKYNEICSKGACRARDCTTSADCSSGGKCVGGQCLVSCAATCECPSGYECNAEQICAPRTQATKPCKSDCDCDLDGGERCVEAVCKGK